MGFKDAPAALDAFHAVKLGHQAVDEVRRRLQREIHGRHGRKNRQLGAVYEASTACSPLMSASTVLMVFEHALGILNVDDVETRY